MTKETRDFPVAVIASITTGVLLCDSGAVHKAVEFLMGHPIWAHHFDKKLWMAIQKAALEQYPEMPIKVEGATTEDYRERVAELEARHGKTLMIRKGSGTTASLPTAGLDEDKTTIVQV
jgi:hypothetical protein